MDQKFIAFLLMVSFTAGYSTHICLMKSNNKPEKVLKEDSSYLDSIRDYLENQIKMNEEQNKEKYFLDYTLTDFFSIFDTSVPDKEELPLSTLVYKVLEIKVDKIIQGEILSFTEAFIGLVCFYMVSEM